MNSILLGVFYGVVIGYIGFGLAGGGHGIMTFLMLVSAPLSVFSGGFALFLLPVLTGLLAWLSGSRYRAAFLGLMLSHYVVGAGMVLYFFQDDFLDVYRHFPRLMWTWLACGLIVYLTWNVLLWMVFAQRRAASHTAA